MTTAKEQLPNIQYRIKNDHTFDPIELTFIPSGKDSWKEIVRGKAVASPMSSDLITYRYDESFLTSDWKYFHDALKSYRLDIIRDVLPKYGICVA
ncbi:hypothetical protein [Photobacterium profundum]|uniref:hypothetical protein n=1 Tax=Photobacterium profundum TaxID=74109 RepID=UPI003D0E10F6